MDVIELIKKDLQNDKDMYGRPMIDSYVILKKDDKGYYIEYAFKDGAPHDNRCLSWYDSYQEKAYLYNGWCQSNGVDLPEEETRKILDSIRKKREERIGKIFRLYSFTCGYEEDEKGRLEEAEKSWIEFKEYHSDENGVMEPFVPGDHICKVGCPAKECDWVKNKKHPWTYEEPVKCACWKLEDGVTMEEFINNYKIMISASELAKLL